MAKSIRSKVKKRNRTEMRKTVGDPHQKKLQARCTAKLQNAVAFSQGTSISKLKALLTNAQEDNPPTRETSKNGFSFRHPLAPPPPLEDKPRGQVRGRARGRRRSDVEASLGGEDTVMGDVEADGSAAAGGQDRGKAAEMAPNLKKTKKTRRKNWYEYPSPANPAPPSSSSGSSGGGGGGGGDDESKIE